MIYTHYYVAILEGGGLARGMYTGSHAYATPELARQLGPVDPRLGRGRPIALVQVDTFDDTFNGRPTRTSLREMILEILPGLSGEPIREQRGDGTTP